MRKKNHQPLGVQPLGIQPLGVRFYLGKKKSGRNLAPSRVNLIANLGSHQNTYYHHPLAHVARGRGYKLRFCCPWATSRRMTRKGTRRSRRGKPRLHDRSRGNLRT